MEKHNTSVITTGSNVADGIILIRDNNNLRMIDMSSDPLMYWKAKKEEGILLKPIVFSILISSDLSAFFRCIIKSLLEPLVSHFSRHF